jgi:hypothetical protein
VLEAMVVVILQNIVQKVLQVALIANRDNPGQLERHGNLQGARESQLHRLGEAPDRAAVREQAHVQVGVGGVEHKQPMRGANTQHNPRQGSSSGDRRSEDPVVYQPKHDVPSKRAHASSAPVLE